MYYTMMHLFNVHIVGLNSILFMRLNDINILKLIEIHINFT